MPRRDPEVRGPEVATFRDIDAVNQLFSDAFTDRYQRDGMAGVRVPFLNPQVWRYALEGAGTGAMIWRDAEDKLAAFNLAHCSGTEGWMGPLAVRTALQGVGLGTRIVRAGMAHLQAQGALTIGLETMPRTVDNIGFYGRLGFLPGHLTVTVSKEVSAAPRPAPTHLSRAGADQSARLHAACASLTHRHRPGADYSRELAITAARSLGDTTVLEHDGVVLGFAVWHSAALAAGRPQEELRVLKLVAEDPQAFDRLLVLLEAGASAQGLSRVTIRAESADSTAFHRLMEAGYRVLWTDLRMTLQGFPEQPRTGAVIFSNWEI